MALLFLLQLVLARIFGASSDLDTYLAAYAFPLVVGGVLAGGLGSVVVPLHSELSATHGENVAAGAVKSIGLRLLLVSSALAIGMAILADTLVKLVYPDVQADAAAEIVRLLRILNWLVPINTLIGFLYGVDHARRRFFLPAFAGLLGPAATVLLFVLAGDRTTTWLAWSTLLGGGLGVSVLLRDFPWRAPDIDPQLRVFRRFWMLLAPLLIGAACAQLVVLVDRPLAIGLTEGSVSRMGYAWRIASAVASLATSGLAVVIFPALAQHAARGDRQQLRNDLAEGWRFLVVVLVPVVLGILFCGKAIIAALYQSGEFQPQDTAAVAYLLNLYLGLILAAGFGEPAVRTFYALGKTWLPPVIGTAAFLLGSLAKFLVVDQYGTTGLVATTSIYYLAGTAAYVVLLRWEGLTGTWRGVPLTFIRALIAGGLAVGCAVWIMQSASLAAVTCGIVTAVLLYAGLLRLMGDEFARRTFQAAREWIGRTAK